MFSQKQPRVAPIVNSLRSAFGFRLKRRRIASHVDSEDHDDFVWDVSNPFAPLDPTQAHLQALIQAEIARMRRYESLGPLQLLPNHIQPHDGWNDDEDEDSDDEDKHGDDPFESDDEDGDSENADADDEDDDSDDDDKHREANRPNVIVLHTLPPPPPPSPSSDTASTDDGEPLWHGLAQVYNDLAKAEERARKARRDAHRSRLKALTV